jgi:CHRD domain-containing protein
MVILITSILATIVISMASILPTTALAQQSFTAKLSGSNEVPPVTTPGSGIATFHLNADGKLLDYQVNLTKMDNVMAAHIHSGKQGVNGQPVAGLFNPSMSGPPTGAVNGILKKGTLSSSDLSGSLAGKQISDLVNMIKSGGAYVNIHTTKHQNGEIRGQIS